MNTVDVSDVRACLTIVDRHSGLNSFHYVIGGGRGELLQIWFVGQVLREAAAGTVSTMVSTRGVLIRSQGSAHVVFPCRIPHRQLSPCIYEPYALAGGAEYSAGPRGGHRVYGCAYLGGR
jgi:hypothetical protein